MNSDSFGPQKGLFRLGSPEDFPRELLEEAESILAEIEAHSPELADRLRGGRLYDRARLVLPMSRFVVRSLCQLHEWFVEALDAGGTIPPPLSREELMEVFRKELSGIREKEPFFRQIRRLKRFHAAIIAWHDLSGQMEVVQVLSSMTALAEAAMEEALAFAIEKTSEGRLPKAAVLSKASTLCTLGMGKLGGGELNFSSDVDLMFCFQPTEELQGHEAEELYTRSARLFISTLNQTTQDGYVFRTDTRLRPFGDSGPLVLSVDAMEEYYQNHGRQWERYALIKARPVAGSLETGARLLDALRPFLYRRYLDYSTIESLREIKQMIEDELREKGLARNVKLGPGGIREVEFIVQTFQLIKGGRLPALRTTSLLEALQVIRELELLPRASADLLRDAYLVLRAVENRLQEWDDQQTHVIPEDEDRRCKLALSMGLASWEALEAMLEHYRNGVHAVFSGLFLESASGASGSRSKGPDGSAAGGTAGGTDQAELRQLWLEPDSPQALQLLRELGYRSPEEAAKAVSAFRGSRKLATMSEQGIRLLNRLMPRVIAACASASSQVKALSGVIQILEAVLRRTSYLSLLLEYPRALETLVHLCGQSRLITQILSRQPILLDELVDPVRLREPLTRPLLESQLSQVMASIAPDDDERRLDELRLFKKAGIIKTAAADLEGIIDVDQVGRQLTDIAEVILARCLEEADRKMARAGAGGPDSGTGLVEAAGLAVIALGKAGSREMGYTSDLDLIFLYDLDSARETGTPGAELNYLLTRLVHRLIHLLTTRTSQGILYEIDTRLRPDGAQGLLVSSLDTFFEYQQEKAWIWEHQALIRGRFMAGSRATGKRFQQTRRKVLAVKRDRQDLRRQIAQMRQKLITARGGKKAEGLHLKSGPGSILDIEFITQYLTLAHAASHPQILEFTSTTDILTALMEAEVVDGALCRLLCQAFKAFRRELGRLSLDLEPPITRKEHLLQLQKQVLDAWRMVMED